MKSPSTPARFVHARHAVVGGVLGVAATLGACFPGSVGTMGSPSGDGAFPPGATQAANIALQRGVRRLSRREYNNVVHDLLGDTTAPANDFGIEVYVNGFDNGSDGLTVQGTDVSAFQAAAEALAAKAVAGDLTPLIGSCNPQTNADACIQGFLTTFVKKAYRRPPTDTEVARLRALNTAGAAAGGFNGGLSLMLEGILQSPAFLYREELGASDPSLPADVVQLTDYEIASELSFLVTGSMPDDELLAAADASQLRTPDAIAKQAARLMATPAAKPAVRAFMHQWMATDQTASTNKDSVIYPTFNPAVATSMATELDRFLDNVLWQGEGSIRELFTSSQSFIDGNLAKIYGVTAPKNDFDPVTLDSNLRKGILSRAGFLAVHSDTDSSGPVPRGVFVLNALLCRPPPPPPANVPPAPPVSTAVSAHQTTRQRFDAHLNEPACKGCHTVIDGVGFGFEQFDGIGTYRTTENGSPVDTSGNLIGTDVDGPFIGVAELATKLATSQELLDCFARQTYRYAMGQEEATPTAPLVTAIGKGFTSSSPVTGVFASLIADPAFVLRTTSNTTNSGDTKQAGQ